MTPSTLLDALAIGTVGVACASAGLGDEGGRADESWSRDEPTATLRVEQKSEV